MHALLHTAWQAAAQHGLAPYHTRQTSNQPSHHVQPLTRSDAHRHHVPQRLHGAGSLVVERAAASHIGAVQAA